MTTTISETLPARLYKNTNCIEFDLKQILQEQLNNSQRKIAKITQNLSEKETIISQLKAELHNAIEQIAYLQNSPATLPVGKSAWMARPLPRV